jgi:hypothetical protein
VAGSRITPKSDAMSGTQRLTGAQVEELAIVFVTEYERRQGRVPVNTRQGDTSQFRLHILGGDRLARLLTKTKHQSYYLVPWPVRDYDAGE